MDGGDVMGTGNSGYGALNVSDWHNMLQVDGGGSHSLGLNPDGSIIAIGSNQFGKTDTESWNEIIQISAGGRGSAGLKKDESVLEVGENYYGEYNTWWNLAISDIYPSL